MNASQLDAALIAAYRNAHYRIEADPASGEAGFVLQIDQFSQALSDWQAHHDVDCSALITACNLRGQALDAAENERLTFKFKDSLRRKQRPFRATTGLDPDQQWPPEPGFLIAGMALAPARECGRAWAQNAIVWSGPDAIPRLILLR